MPRKPRPDLPGRWFHIFNRGVAKRLICFGPEDHKMLETLLAEQVGERRIEVHAYCLMGTHFHLLLRSPKGQVSEAMRQVQHRFSSWSNRRNRRDGPLFRGRFARYIADEPFYRRHLIRYIDFNPVHGGLVVHPGDYEHGSARSWIHRPMKDWLATEWIESLMRPGPDSAKSRSQRYQEQFSGAVSDRIRTWIARSMLCGQPVASMGRPLLALGDDQVRAWMLRKLRLADGAIPGQPLVPDDAVEWTLARASTKGGLGTHEAGPARAFLLRTMAGLSLREVAERIGISRSAAHRRCEQVKDWLADESESGGQVARIAREVVAVVLAGENVAMGWENGARWENGA